MSGIGTSRTHNLFPPVPKSDWLARVKRDLKGRDLSELDFQLAGHAWSPFHHPQDQSTPPQPVPGMPVGHRRVGIRIDARTDFAAANRIALEVLRQGADLLLFEVEDALELSKKDRRTLFDGILTDIIDIVFVQAESMGSYDLLTIVDADGALQYEALEQDLGTALFFVVSDLLEEGSPTGPVIHVAMADKYYENIARLRAFRLCWHLAAETIGHAGNCRLIAHVPADEADASDNKIAASAQALSALVGGANGLIVTPSDGDGGTTFSRRVALNLQHVIEYESHVVDVPDPAAGSYFLEALTERIAADIWAKFQSLSQDPIYQNF